VNPLAKFVGALIIAGALLFTLSPWVAAGFVILELMALPLLGVSGKTLLRVGATLSLAAVLAGLTNALYGNPHGVTVFAWGPMHVTAGSIEVGFSVALRILAIGLPGALLMSTVDPTDLADALAQLWRLPARFVYGCLAAVRMLALLANDWRTLSMARRARGVGSGRGPFAAIARVISQAFALFVVALRRANTLSIAMDARGLGAYSTRSWARTSVWRPRDWTFIAVVTALALGGLVTAFWINHG